MSTEILINSFGGQINVDHCKGEVGEYLKIVESFINDLLTDWKEKGPFNHEVLQREVSIVFLDTDKKALFVSVDESKYQICIGSGLVVLILDLFLFLMSDPAFMSSIGNCDSEEKRAQPNNNYFTECRVLRHSPSGDIYESGFLAVPYDEERVKNAFSMCYDVIEYLIYHEFSHILRGHLQIAKNALGHSEIIEQSIVSAYEEEDLIFGSYSAIEIWQFLELDADRMAADLMFKMILPEEGDITEERTHELNRRSLSIAIYMMIHGTNTSINDYRRSRYPHPSVRFRMLISWLFSLTLHGDRAEFSDMLFQEFTKNISIARNIFKEIPLVDSTESPKIDEEEKRLKDWYFSLLEASEKYLEETSNVWRR